MLGGDPGFNQYDQSYAAQGVDYQEGYAQQQPYPPQSYQQPAYPQQSYPQQQPYAQPSYPPQPPFPQPPYVETPPVTQDYNQGYAHREGLAPSGAASSIHRPRFSFLKSRWPGAFMAVTGIQAAICLGFEAYVFGRFQTSLHGNWVDDSEVQSQYKTIPTFLTLFIFGFLYELVVVWDALRMKNTIQVIGVCIANLALMTYTALQVDQIRIALNILGAHGALKPSNTATQVWEDIRPYLVAIPAIIGLGSVGMAFVSWKLYQVFAWDILKNIGADYRMKKRFLHYQIYIALLKFDFFFFLGFIVQFVVIVTKTNDPEFALTIATIPVTIAILLAAAYFARRENKPGMICVIILYFGGLSYFLFKLVRIYQPGHEEDYMAVRKSLTAFAVITILLIILTIANAIVCMTNFGKGLKTHLMALKRVEEKPDLNSINLSDVKPQQPSRMTIE
jgi:hypothetical protein